MDAGLSNRGYQIQLYVGLFDPEEKTESSFIKIGLVDSFCDFVLFYLGFSVGVGYVLQ